MKDKIYQLAPIFIQNLMVSLFNLHANRKRFGGRYKEFRQLFYKNRTLSRQELLDSKRERYKKFLQHTKANSSFYKKLYSGLTNIEAIDNIRKLPIVNKEMLRVNINDVVIDSHQKLLVFKTGGTTGKSLEVKYTLANSQERFAMLDDFRARFGYELGKKTAWFSGKNLLTKRDIKNKRFWKTDYWHKVRYYSTFHIKEDYLKYYVENLIKYKPEFFVGFPSTMLEIARYGLKQGYDFPKGTIKAIFPTAETVSSNMRHTIETFFKTKMYDQYASSEGAPFIFECEEGNLHLELQSGVFEVLDENNLPAKSGRLVVTSFTTEATPLIRYDIGDSITLDDPDKICSCGNNNPLVTEILGRIDDYIYSPENGKINLGNISNTLKDTKGIQSFQVVQDQINALEILVVTDEKLYDKKYESIFIQNWRDRVGDNMQLTLHYVQEIPVEKSGKFRIVKNKIKHLINAQT
jgi:phenylacetate-CoA ligase